MAELKKCLPKPYIKRKYYNLSELAQHSHPNDLWVAFFHEIYDLTRLVQQNIQRTNNKLFSCISEAVDRSSRH